MHTRFAQQIGVAMLLLLMSSALIGCQPIEPIAVSAPIDDEAVYEEFVAVALALEEAYQEEDLDAVLAFYADDAVSHAPGFPSDAGKEAIEVAYSGYFDAYEVQRDFELTDVEVGNEFASRTFEWTQVSTPRDGGDPITEVGRCILGWKKVEGEWKVAWEIWNTYDAQ